MLVSLTLLASCSKELETTPTDKTTSDVVFSTGSGAYAAINGIYRYMYMTGYTPSWGCGKFWLFFNIALL